ncbi:MAG: polymer-forming cytoskeletal protein [Candidatus Gracilibacteria bacterium]|nr:polymer-forming cytoskeletal protein [Candidatus Gracilibacteria bacterium]
MKKLLTLLTAGLLTAGLFVTPVLALEIAGGEEFTIPEGKVYDDNLIVGGGVVEIEGTVNGDLIAGGGYITITGTINGDVLVGGGRVEFEKDSLVTGDLKMMGGMLDLAGNVSEDVTVYSGQLDLSGEVLALSADAGQARISGKVLENLDIRAGMLTFSEGVEIGGNLNYSSPNEVKFPEGFTVGGEIVVEEYYSEAQLEQMEESDQMLGQRGFMGRVNVAAKFMSYLMILLLGAILLNVAPNYVLQISLQVKDHFWKSLGLGFLSLIVVPIAVVILLFTVVGIPLSIILVMLYLIAVYLVPIWPSYLLGSKLLKLHTSKAMPKYAKRLGALALGLAIYEILMLIPILSTLIYLVVLFVGLGALLLAKHSLLKEGNKKGLI